MRRSILLTFFSLAAITFAACTPETPPVRDTTKPAASPTAVPSIVPNAEDKAPVDPKAPGAAFVGRWPGVEGTYLNVEAKGEKFDIEIKDLDGSKKYEGTAKGDTIEFTRNGKTETIKKATADETGMKWLQDKKNCVVITKGSEGYCRD